MTTEFMTALRGVYDEDSYASTTAPPKSLHGSKRSTHFEKLRRMRLVWDRRQDKSLPFNFSFVVPGKIAGMALPTSQEQLLNIAKDHSIGLVCSMIEEENIPYQDLLNFNADSGIESLQNIHVDWRDLGTPDRREIERMLVQVKEFMDQNPSKAVVFHCYAGKGRTGTAIAAFLIKFHGMTGVESIKHVRQFRQGSIETREQERWLVDYYNSLHPDQQPEAYLNE